MSAEVQHVVEIPIAQLADSPYQPRQDYDPDVLRELTDSIRQNGVLQPCPCRRVGPDEYELIGGHTRKRAAIAAGLDTLPCIVKELTDEDTRLLVILDNMSRADFLPWEEGAAYADLREQGWTVDRICQETGRSPAVVSSRLGVAAVGTVLKRLYLDGELTLFALEQVAELPNETLSPKRCPGCQGVNREDAETCAGCGTSLATVMALPVGNPQEAAAQMSRNKQNGDVREILRRVRQSYGLDRQVVQTSLGLSVAEIDACAVETKHRFERMLADVAKVAEKLCDDKALSELRQATATQRSGIQQQLTAAQKILGTLAQELNGQPALGVA